MNDRPAPTADDRTATCPMCGGDGIELVRECCRRNLIDGECRGDCMEAYEDRCPYCNGSGEASA